MRGLWVSVSVAALAATLFLSAPAAHADQVITFTLTTYQYAGDPGTAYDDANGTVTIDTTTGVVNAINMSFAGIAANQFSLGTAWDQFGNPPGEFSEFFEGWNNASNSNFISIDIILPVATFVGYTGGTICSSTQPCYSLGFPYSSTYGTTTELVSYTSGLLTPVPEPSSLLLLSTGALGLFGLFRHKFIA